MATEQITQRSNVRMGVDVYDWPDGRTGIRVDIGESSYIFSIDGAKRMRDALANQIVVAEGRALDHAAES